MKQLDSMTKNNTEIEAELQKLMKDREAISVSYTQLKQQSADRENQLNKDKSELE